ncbi:MAG: hypothetical protein HYV18_03885 [Gammaproteobacteria bacterium]|nr:hypothetical protein [Gammaproteobacteria bacterium]
MDDPFLASLLAQLQPVPGSLLLAMPAGPLRDRLCAALAPLHPRHLGRSGLTPADHFDAAVAHVTADRTAAEWRALLAALRDRHAGRTLAILDERSPVQAAECAALGFRRVAHTPGLDLFRFDLYDYKDRPDWLNPRHWAHPELWDKFRW